MRHAYAAGAEYPGRARHGRVRCGTGRLQRNDDLCPNPAVICSEKGRFATCTSGGRPVRWEPRSSLLPGWLLPLRYWALSHFWLAELHLRRPENAEETSDRDREVGDE